MPRAPAKDAKPAPPGLIRTLAQEHDRVQNPRSIMKAIAWCRERKHWSTKKLFDYLFNLVDPLMGLEKSPETVGRMKYIERAYQFFPRAYYLHLTRHPVSTRKSLLEFSQQKRTTQGKSINQYKLDPLLSWYLMHNNIVNFTKTLPVGQTMRIKGEDLLSQPDVYLPQIAQWLGLRTDPDAIEAMKHPESSPYAYVGPFPIRGGNDPKFMRSPKLRQGKVKEPSLAQFLAENRWQAISDLYQQILTEAGLVLLSEQKMTNKIVELAHLLGYE